MSQHTADSFYDGRIRVYQNRDGYRFSLDPILLAHHVNPKPGDHVVDLGTGCGILPLLLAYRNPEITCHAVEIQKSLFDVACKNIRANGFEDRIGLFNRNMEEVGQDDIGGACDIIVTNPPYRRPETGRCNPSNEKAVARFETCIDLAGWTRTARRLLRTGGRLFVIYPAERLSELFHQLMETGFAPKVLRMVHSFPDGPAQLVIVESIARGGNGLTTRPPLYLYEKEEKNHTEEVMRMFHDEKN